MNEFINKLTFGRPIVRLFPQLWIALRDRDNKDPCLVSLRDQDWCLEVYTDHRHIWSTQFVGFYGLPWACTWQSSSSLTKLSIFPMAFSATIICIITRFNNPFPIASPETVELDAFVRILLVLNIERAVLWGNTVDVLSCFNAGWWRWVSLSMRK